MKSIVYFIFTCLSISTEYRVDFPYPYRLTQVGGRSVNKAERNQAKQLYKKLHNAVKKHKIRHGIEDGIEDFDKKDNNGKDLKREFLKKYSRKKYSSISSSRSSKPYKEEFQETVWVQKQYDALNSTQPKGDFVNMVAARPEGVHCGDPYQHDMPWGTCMYPQECEPGYRIYRGDLHCGRNEFICCAVVGELYDLNMPFDLSFESSAFKSNSKDKDNYQYIPPEMRKLRRKRDRRKARLARKKMLKKRIEFIVQELRNILKKAYRNSSKAKQRKTKQIKLFLKELKRQAKKDRQSVRDVHTVEMIRIDARFKKALARIKDLNQNFLKNGTFQNLILNIDGKEMITKQTALMLQEYYPQLREYFPAFRADDEEIGNLTYDLEFSK